MPHETARPTTYLIVTPQACPNPRHEPAHVRQMQQQAPSPPQPNSQLLQACAVLQNKPMFQQQHQQHHQYQQQHQHQSSHMCPSPRHEPAHVRQQQQYQLHQQQLPHLQPASQWGYAANAVQGPGSGTPGTSSPDSARLLNHYPNVTSKFTGLASPASNPSPWACHRASQVAQNHPGNPSPYDQPHRATTAPASTLLATADADSPLQSQPEGLPPWLSLPCAPHTPTQQPQAGFRAVQPMAGLLAEMPKMRVGTGGEEGNVQGPGSSPWQQQIPRQQRQQQQQQPPPPLPSHQQQLPHQAQVESQPLQTSESLSSCLTMGNEYTLEQLEEATNNFSEANRLGQGGFAVVYSGYLQQLHVAVKKPATRIDPESIRHFKVESNVLSTINHPNIIPLIGTCPEEGILVYKLAPLGSLHDNLFGVDQGPGDYSLMCPATAGAPPQAGSSAGASNPFAAPARRKHPPLTWKQCIKAVWHVARGLVFFHYKGLVHRDIKPQNILLSENKKGPVGMLGDVGLTKLVKKKTNGNNPSRLAGTLGYVPPECLDEVTGKWDIYALGIVLLQLVSKDRLVKGGQLRKAMMAAYNPDAATFIQAIDPRWADAPDAAKQLMALALNCTEKDPACRPTAEELATALLEMKRGASISTTSASSASQADAMEDDAAVQASDLEAALLARPVHKPLPGMMVAMEDSPLLTEQVAGSDVQSMIAGEQWSAITRAMPIAKPAAKPPTTTADGPPLLIRGRPLGSKTKLKPAPTAQAAPTRK
ncbi:kinase-like domain-containing protein [Haematococcus lacustris]